MDFLPKEFLMIIYLGLKIKCMNIGVLEKQNSLQRNQSCLW